MTILPLDVDITDRKFKVNIPHHLDTRRRPSYPLL
jgi:hypothetical protein